MKPLESNNNLKCCGNCKKSKKSSISTLYCIKDLKNPLVEKTYMVSPEEVCRYWEGYTDRDQDRTLTNSKLKDRLNIPF